LWLLLLLLLCLWLLRWRWGYGLTEYASHGTPDGKSKVGLVSAWNRSKTSIDMLLQPHNNCVTYCWDYHTGITCTQVLAKKQGG